MAQLVNRIKSSIPSLVFFLIGLIAFIQSFNFPAAQTKGFTLGPAFWPRMISVVLMGASFTHISVLVWSNSHKSQGNDCNARPIPSDQKAKHKGKSNHESQASSELNQTDSTFWHVTPAILLGFLYVYLIPKIGFLFLTPFAMVTYMIILGARDWKKILLTSLAVYVSILLVFVKLLYLPIPEGTIVFFRNINVFLIELVS